MRPVTPWRVVRSEITFSDQWLTVRSDECVTDAGESIAPYHVIEYPDCVNIVAIGTDGLLVLVRQYRHGIGAVATELPCGMVEATDASAIAAAERELLEETGMRTLHARQVCRLPVNSANHSNHVTTVAVLCEPGGKPSALPGEHVEIVRRTPAAFLESILDPACTLQASHVAAFLLALQAMRADPGFARVAQTGSPVVGS